MNQPLFRRIVFAAACCALALSTGCGAKPEIIRIGAILPLSGAGADLGNQHLHGLQLAIEELNASNPSVQYELVVDSDRSDAAAAIDAFKAQLLDKKILVAYVVGRSSCLGVIPRAETEFVPVFANCRHPLITTMYGNTFRVVPSTALEIRTTARFLASSLKTGRASVLYFDNDEGNDAARAFENELPQNGIKMLVAKPFTEDGASVTSAVGEALAPNPDAVFVFGAGKAAAGVLAALRSAGFKGAIAVSADCRDPGFASLAGASLEGCHCAVPAIELSGNPGFAATYQKRFNASPTAIGIFAYDAMRVVAKAVDIKRVEEISMMNALKKVGDYSGAGGGYAYFEREWLPQMKILKFERNGTTVVH